MFGFGPLKFDHHYLMRGGNIIGADTEPEGQNGP